jgi:hypothetical protein
LDKLGGGVVRCAARAGLEVPGFLTTVDVGEGMTRAML